MLRFVDDRRKKEKSQEEESQARHAREPIAIYIYASFYSFVHEKSKTQVNLFFTPHLIGIKQVNFYAQEKMIYC